MKWARAVAERVRACLHEVVRQAYEAAGLSGFCPEGRWDLALDRLVHADLNPVARKALRAQSDSEQDCFGSGPARRGQDAGRRDPYSARWVVAVSRT